LEQVNLLDYCERAEGDPLLVLGADDTEALIRSKQKEVDSAMEEMEKAEKTLANFTPWPPFPAGWCPAPLRGAGGDSGQTVITISDVSVMTVEIQVDERNIGYVKPGMLIDLDQWGNIFTPSGGIGQHAGQRPERHVHLPRDCQGGQFLRAAD
jgi:hypothetical protein